ncbi:stage II sporulation protein M [Candidatus Woesearchaeota archaeon]|nr:stage II sporulation protein M [Candidatus Woesearchaeota archaeon]
MVLESLITPQNAEKKWWELFVIGFLYSAMGIFLAIWIFEQYSSLVMVFLTVTAAVPLMYNTMKYEEHEDCVFSHESQRLVHHMKIIRFLVFLFLGFVLAFTLAYVFLPTALVETTFSSQMQTINAINSKVSGDFTADIQILEKIFLNNIKVLLFCIFFAFFYGAGAIFILTWNASVISAAVGNIIRTNLAVYASDFGLNSLWTYFSIFSVGILRYLIHGVPEIVGYFIGGIAGSVISVAMINHDFSTTNFKKVLIDSISLIILAVFVLLIAALMEVFLTPLLF